MAGLEFLPVAGYDCETTGTDTARDRVVSAALVRRSGDGRTSCRTWLIDPGVEIPAEAVAIHGITTEQARADGADPAVALDEIAQALAEAVLEGLPLVIYNASFDLRILDAELARHGLPSLAQRARRLAKPVLDPLVIDRGVDRYRKGGRTLPDLLRVYGLPAPARLHDAADDVVNTIALLDAIRRRHPQLPTDLRRLHDWQIGKHSQWAIGYNDWLQRQGREPTADDRWP